VHVEHELASVVVLNVEPAVQAVQTVLAVVVQAVALKVPAAQTVHAEHVAVFAASE
jgi:hypothetical protein